MLLMSSISELSSTTYSMQFIFAVLFREVEPLADWFKTDKLEIVAVEFITEFVVFVDALADDVLVVVFVVDELVVVLFTVEFTVPEAEELLLLLVVFVDVVVFVLLPKILKLSTKVVWWSTVLYVELIKVSLLVRQKLETSFEATNEPDTFCRLGGVVDLTLKIFILVLSRRTFTVETLTLKYIPTSKK